LLHGLTSEFTLILLIVSSDTHSFMTSSRSISTYPNPSKANVSLGLLTPDQLDLAIEKERMRANRHRITFSVIVLRADAKTSNERRTLNARMAAILQSRLRLTDESGQRQNGDLGILLPHTHGVGARVVLRSLIDLAEQEEIRFASHRIYVYPHLSSGDDEDSSNLEGMSDSRIDGILFQGADESFVGGSILRMKSTRSDELGEDGDASELIAPAYPTWKRTSDIIIASIGLFMALPIIVLASIAIRLTSSGPVFFHQWRTGHFGRPFRILKLRTMVVDAEELKAKLQRMNERDGPAFKMKCDPRVTRVGKFLRATGLDELPQLWNVLKGDMAIVGPRPLPCDEDANCEPWHRRRLDTRPGITCFWQIMKSRVESFDDWMRLDLQYLAKRSFTQDVVLMVKTVLAVVLGRVGH
jgi:lipopolysaccharide/colanic/teichoic acid biosynthesis glycosyltransferase